MGVEEGGHRHDAVVKKSIRCKKKGSHVAEKATHFSSGVSSLAAGLLSGLQPKHVHRVQNQPVPSKPFRLTGKRRHPPTTEPPGGHMRGVSQDGHETATYMSEVPPDGNETATLVRFLQTAT